MRWDKHPEADRTLRAMWQDGASATEIAREMGLSRNAVIGRIHRLRNNGANDLRSRDSVATFRRTSTQRAPKPNWPDLGLKARETLLESWQRRGRTIRQAMSEVTNGTRDALRSFARSKGVKFADGRIQSGTLRKSTKSKPLRGIRNTAPAVPPTCDPVGFFDLDNRTCRFDLSNHVDRIPFDARKYCGGPANLAKGQPYCPYHAQITYVPPEQRKAAA